MTTITTRATKGTELTHNEGDANLSKNAQAKVGNYTVAEGDNNDTIQCAGTFTITLPDAATIAAASDSGDFEVILKVISGTITVGRTTGTDTIDGTAANITLVAGDTVLLKVNQAGNGYNITNTKNEFLNITNGTVAASKSVVVDANKDAIGFRKVTGTAPDGYAAAFYSSGTTSGDSAVFGYSTAAAGTVNGVSGRSDSSTGRGVIGHASHASGATVGGIFQNDSSAGIAVNAVTTIEGGIPISAAAFDAADNNPGAILSKGGRQLRLNPRSAALGYNPIVVLGDQTIIAIGPSGVINTGAVVLAPHATDAVGIRMDSATDTVVISGATTIASLTSTTATITTATITTATITTLNGVAARSIVILDTPEVLFNGSTVNGSWQTHSSATLAAANAKTAILRYMIEPNNTAGNTVAFAFVRKTGSALSNSAATRVAYARTFATGASATGSGAVSQCEVNLDVNNDFDWYTQLLTGTSIVTDIVLVGYYI